MKKNSRNLVVFILLVVFFQSCGDPGFDRDIKKLSEIECKRTKLLSKFSSDKSAQEEFYKLANDSKEFIEQMEKKYSSESDQKKVAKAIAKEICW
jgi:thiamine biosynthesis lipoprotein ApbE